MRWSVWSLLLLLLVLHQDYWQWDDATLDFGFLPRALTYHVGISLAASLFWWWTTWTCWPQVLQEAAVPAGDLKREVAPGEDPP